MIIIISVNVSIYLTLYMTTLFSLELVLDIYVHNLASISHFTQILHYFTNDTFNSSAFLVHQNGNEAYA